MRRNEVRIALQAAKDWEQKGMFRPGAYEHIQATLARTSTEPGLAMQSFYAIGGILLGAATAALYALLRINDLISANQEVAWIYFLVCAGLLLGAGIGIHFMRQKELGDAILIAGLVPLGILLGPETPGYHEAWRILTIVGAAGILFLRRNAHLVPVLAAGLAAAAYPIVVIRWLAVEFGDNDLASLVWLMGALLMWAGMAAWNRLSPPRWADEGGVFTTLSLIGAWLMFIIEFIQPDFTGGFEVVLALALIPMIAAGIWLRQRGILFTAGAALTIDAIVFAFDSGGPTAGLITLVGLAAALIAAATLLRQRTRKAQTPGAP